MDTFAQGSDRRNRLSLAIEQKWLSGIWLMTAGLIVLLIATLHPVEFDPRGISTPVSFDGITDRFELNLGGHGSFIDFSRNVLLFMPFGFGTGILFHRLLANSARTAAATLVTSIGLSLVVEILQVWYPSRIPSLRDVLANGMGGLLGSAIYLLWGKLILQWIAGLMSQFKRVLVVQTLIAGYVAYIVLVIVTSIYILREARLDGWDLSYHLGVGNELSGDRPWRGTISELHIADRAFSRDQVAHLFAMGKPAGLLREALVTSYEFESLGDYRDRTGNLPDLVWQGPRAGELNGAAVPVSEESWLATSGSAGRLSEKLMESSQFTLITSFIPAEPQQWGGARIVTISRDPSRRNLTLEHLGADLRVRFRTGVTGENAMKPVIAVPDLFADNSPHRLIITYDGANLSIYVDSIERAYRIAMTPEVTLLHQILGTRWYRLTLGGLQVTLYKFLYYSLIFIPAGLLLALLLARADQQQMNEKFPLMAGILLPAVTLEIILAATRAPDFPSLLMSLTIIVVVLRAARPWARNFLSI